MGIWSDLVWGVVLGIYVLIVVVLGLPLYRVLRRRYPHGVAIYFIRKYIHMAGGGVVALLTPYLFEGPLVPTLMGLGLGLFLVVARRWRMLYWFQTGDNAYEVNFTLAWSISLFVLWSITGDPWLSVVPALLISFGDGVTGVIRNILFKRRTKHWAGNIAMLPVSMGLGYVYGGIPGLVAGAVASVVEKLELPPIDDNIIIATVSSLVIIMLHFLGWHL